MAYGELNGHMADDFTWSRKFANSWPQKRLEPNISKTAGNVI